MNHGLLPIAASAAKAEADHWRMLAERWLAKIRKGSIPFFLRPIYIGTLGKLKPLFPWSFFLGKLAWKIGFWTVGGLGNRGAGTRR